MFTAQYGMSPYIKQTRLVFKGLNDVYTKLRLLFIDLVFI